MTPHQGSHKTMSKRNVVLGFTCFKMSPIQEQKMALKMVGWGIGAVVRLVLAVLHCHSLPGHELWMDHICISYS